MDQNCKKKIALVKGFIQKKQYKQAIDELQVLMYKYSKVYQVHLMSGLCYEKLGKQIQAEKCYKEALELKEDQPNAIKALCQIYTKRNDIKNATTFLQKNVEILKKVDDLKYRQARVKLVEIYRKDQVLQKIFTIFCDYIDNQQKIGEDFVQIADAYFRVSILCKSFNLQKFQLMGIKGQQPRLVQMNARQRLNILLIDIVNYLMAVSKQYNLTQKDIANSLYQMKCYFPYAPCMLMLMLLDEYSVGNVAFSSIILEQIFKLLTSYVKKQDNGYLNMEFTQPQIFTVSMVLGYQYLSFFKEFFTLDSCFDEYFQNLALKQEQFLKSYKVREDYSKKINNFILKKCRHLNKISQTKNVENELEDMKKRIQLLDGSFLQQVIAKMAMHCFVNYQKLDDMKNMLKIRIKNLQQGDMVPHLYKYYVDYLIKIAKIYKILDEEINIYQAIQYITKYDTKDLKYLIEEQWLNFSKSMLLQKQQQKIKIAKQSLQNIQRMVDQTKGQLKGQSLRRIVVLKIYTQNFDVQKQLKEALSTDRSFQNLQCMGFYTFHSKKYQDALNYLKEAFILNQNHYHTNRLIFVLLFKLGYKNEAIDFVDRIKEGFRSVFWINYVLALKYMNLKKYSQAQFYLNASLENFSAGVNKKYKFSFQKTVQQQKFAFLYMIQQNQFTIFYDQIIFPESILYEQLHMVASLHFGIDTKRTQIRLFYQMGEVLKILGRTKSSVNYLNEAYTLSLQLSEQQMNKPGQRFELCVMQKQYATILFYMQMFRESQSTLVSAYQLCRAQLNIQKDQKTTNLLQNIESQIKSLLFQVAVQKLSIMSKFQSHQTVEEYLQQFNVEQPKHPSVNFLKGKYQFYILQYLHRRNSVDRIQSSIKQYLEYFNLAIQQLNTAQFDNRYFELESDKKIMVKEALQDYFVVKYISSPTQLKQTQIMPLIQMFPRSTIFYIIFGMSTTNIELKTASFLKCIQLDRQSPISIDLLASLYLKQKNYLAATKLFLKSLEMNILNSKCYVGLSICLFCIIGKTISSKDNDVVSTIHKALVRINSYMEYLRTVDPSQNYHLLKFLKLLVNDDHISNFQIKTVLQASKKSSKYKYKNTLIYSLLQQATNQWKQHNIWQQEGQIKILDQFVSKFYKKSQQETNKQCLQIAKTVLENVFTQSKQLFSQNNSIRKYEFFIKEIQKLLNQICIVINLAQKTQFSEDLFNSIIELLSQFQTNYQKQIFISEQNVSLIRKIKSYLFQYSILNEKYKTTKNKIINIFSDIKTYDHLSKHSNLIEKFQGELFREILLNPNDEQLKKIHTNYMVVCGGKKINKGKYDYKVELINNTHENLVIKKQTFKKLCILYRDTESYIGYISSCWEEPNSRTKINMQTWLRLIKKLETQPNHHHSQKRCEQTKLKLNSLKLETYSLYLLKNGQTQELKKIGLSFQKNQNLSVQTLSALGQFYQTSSLQNIAQIRKIFSKLQGLDLQFSLLQLLSFLTNKFQFNSKIQSILIQLIQLSESQKIKSTFKAHLLLLRYLYILHRPVKTQDDLVTQILDMENIIASSEVSGIDENTISIMKCSKCLFSADYPNLQIELAIAAKKKIVTYSDQLLINFFEIMRLYKEVQSNPNKQGVIEEFAIYIEQMIILFKDPFYQGFFFSLKAMVNSIIVPDQAFIHDRNLRFSLMLSPSATKIFLKRPQH